MWGLLDRFWTWLCQLFGVRKAEAGAAQSEQEDVGRAAAEPEIRPPVRIKPPEEEQASASEGTSPAREQGQEAPVIPPTGGEPCAENRAPQETEKAGGGETAEPATTAIDDAKRAHDIEPENEPQGRTPKKPKPRRPPTDVAPPKKRATHGPRRPDEQQTKPTIDLGDRERRTQRATQRSGPATRKDRETLSGTDAGPTPLTRILAPFVEFDLKDAKVRLVFPRQTVRLEQSGTKQPKKVSYDAHVNGKVLKVDARLVRCLGDCLRVEEQRIEITSPLKHLDVRFPALLGGQGYTYEHANECVYTFVPTGPDRARLHYSYRDGQPNPLPRRCVWVLVRDPFTPQVQADCEDERAVWETYRASRVDLAEVDSLTLRGGSDTVQLPCAPTFTLHGSATVSDDFAKVEPLFTAGPLTLVAPQPDPAGWRVWVCSRISGHRLLDRDWTGEQPLQIETPGDLPCEGGEFQLDVCQSNEAIPTATFFFRMAPILEMQYPKNLMFPVRTGHQPAAISVVLRGDAQGWQVCCGKGTEVARTEDGFCITVPPVSDIARFEFVKEGQPVTRVPIQVTVPRLRWVLSRNMTWTDTSFTLERDSMRYGIQLDLCARTNMDATRHALSAVLQGGSESLQEARFILRQGIYRLALNSFYEAGA